MPDTTQIHEPAGSPRPDTTVSGTTGSSGNTADVAPVVPAAGTDTVSIADPVQPSPLDTLFSWAEPEFRTRWRGYAPRQVDDYLASLTVELDAARAAQRQALHAATTTATELGACRQQLEQARRELADLHATAAAHASTRIHDMIHLAAEEADAIRAAAQADADRAHAQAKRLLAQAHKDANTVRDACHDELKNLAREADQARTDADRVARMAREQANTQAREQIAALREQITQLTQTRDHILADRQQRLHPHDVNRTDHHTTPAATNHPKRHPA